MFIYGLVSSSPCTIGSPSEPIGNLLVVGVGVCFGGMGVGVGAGVGAVKTGAGVGAGVGAAKTGVGFVGVGSVLGVKGLQPPSTLKGVS